LGTQEKVAEKLGWVQQNVSYYLQIAKLPEDVTTEIRNSVGNFKTYPGKQKKQ